MLLATAALLCALAAPAPTRAAKKTEGLTVLGGEDVAASEYDYVVGIFTRRKNSRVVSSCTGSIIADRWILTAGHCVENTSSLTHNLYALLGSKNLLTAQSIPAEKWFIHEGYHHYENPVLVFNDIALVKLTQPATRVPHTALARLPSAEEAAPRKDSMVTVVGFGVEGEGDLATTRRGVLKKAQMKIGGTCRSTFPYCIRAVDINGRSCPGDSGGPLVYNGKVVGISSTGRTCTTRRGDSQSTWVSRYITWINEKINEG